MGERYHMPDGRIAYRNTEKEKLLALVEKLTEKLGRPVCAADLRRHLRTQPENQPMLLQALGQQLFKAARPHGDDRLHRIGLIGNQAYYAPSNDPWWQSSFEAHSATLTLRQELRMNLPKQAAILLKTTHIAIAQNALAGWLLDMARLRGLNPNLEASHAEQLEYLILHAEQLCQGGFAAKEPADLVPGCKARQIILAEMKRRIPWSLDHPQTRPNLNRYLAGLAWPQCELYPTRKNKVYWVRQCIASAAARWPLDHDPDTGVSVALVHCMRFGEAA